MKARVVHASRYGSTREIAEYIARKLVERGVGAEATSVEAVTNLADSDAVIIGSAVYMGHWMSGAVDFVQRNRTILVGRPVWLFSSGPLQVSPGNPSLDDPKLVPLEVPALIETIHAREHRIFFGCLDPQKLAFKHRALRKLPAARAMLPEGDFRNWNDIEAWVDGIAEALRSPMVLAEAPGGE